MVIGARTDSGAETVIRARTAYGAGTVRGARAASRAGTASGAGTASRAGTRLRPAPLQKSHTSSWFYTPTVQEPTT